MDDFFEHSFGNFLKRNEYDEAAQALYTVVRTAFMAGWSAAGGTPPEPQPIVRLV